MKKFITRNICNVNYKLNIVDVDDLPMSALVSSTSLYYSLLEQGLPFEYYQLSQLILTKKELDKMSSSSTQVSLCTDSDSEFYGLINKTKRYLISMFNKGLKNSRQLVFTNAETCISMFQIIPKRCIEKLSDKKVLNRNLLSYSVVIYQRSAHVKQLFNDLHVMKEIFRDADDITYIISNIHDIVPKNYRRLQW